MILALAIKSITILRRQRGLSDAACVAMSSRARKVAQNSAFWSVATAVAFAQSPREGSHTRSRTCRSIRSNAGTAGDAQRSKKAGDIGGWTKELFNAAGSALLLPTLQRYIGDDADQPNNVRAFLATDRGLMIQLLNVSRQQKFDLGVPLNVASETVGHRRQQHSTRSRRISCVDLGSGVGTHPLVDRLEGAGLRVR